MALACRIFPVTPFQQNCTLLYDEATKRGVVIDPGGEADRLLQAITGLDVSVDSIWLTHGHLDHAGGARALKAGLEARQGGAVPLLGPDRRDDFLLASIADQAARFGIVGLENASPDRFLEEGETLEVGGVTFEVRHCPGHTPGHVIFAAPAIRFAVLGDVLFHGSVGRTDFPYGNHEQLIDSIFEKILPLGDDVQFVCGHGPGSTLGEERRHNPFLAGFA